MKTHLKLVATPKSWPVLRKTHKFITKPRTGKPLEHSMAIATILKQTGIADTPREAKKIIQQKLVSIDCKITTDHKLPVSFMDTVHIKPDMTLRSSITKKGKLQFTQIAEKEQTQKICRIINKHTIKNGKTQLNLSDGRNIITDKKYDVGDSVLIELPKQTIKDHFKLEKGNTALLVGGRHTGTTAIIDEIQGERIWLKENEKRIETLVKFAYIIGKDKPALKL